RAARRGAPRLFRRRALYSLASGGGRRVLLGNRCRRGGHPPAAPRSVVRFFRLLVDRLARPLRSCAAGEPRPGKGAPGGGTDGGATDRRTGRVPPGCRGGGPGGGRERGRGLRGRLLLTFFLVRHDRVSRPCGRLLREPGDARRGNRRLFLS